MTEPAITSPINNMKNSTKCDISTFWQSGIFNSFIGMENTKIQYAVFLQKNSKEIFKPLVIVPGRVESYLKYQELAFDLHQQGYSIFIIDHRGQGLSDRLLKDSNKGYVTKFQDYVDDFSYFIHYVVTEYSNEKPNLLAHSMGGAIAIRFMQDSPNAIKSAVIASPMLAINTGVIPKSVSRLLIKATLKLNKVCSDTPWYFWGQNSYSPTLFTSNRLTHCKERYQRFIELYKADNRVQLGGVTIQWLSEAFKVKETIFKKISRLQTPILLLQAEQDKVVCGKTQDKFCQQLHDIQQSSCLNGEPVKIKGAFHELFFETDEVRDQALKESLSWFNKN